VAEQEDRLVALVSGELQVGAEPVGMKIQEGETDEHGGKRYAVDGEQRTQFLKPGDPVLKLAFANAENIEREALAYELQGVDIEQDDKEKTGVEHDRPGVLQAVPFEEPLVNGPNEHQDAECQSEGDEPLQVCNELREGLGYFQRDDE